MLLNIRSERQSNWTLHMHTVASILPIFFVTNRANYSRWIPVYLLEMSQVPLGIWRWRIFYLGNSWKLQWYIEWHGDRKESHQECKRRWWWYFRIDKKEASFYSIDTLTRHIAAQYSAAMKETIGITSADNSVHQQGKTVSMKQDEDHVRALISHLKNMTNPFDCSFLDHNVLINISTSMHATKEVQSSLLNAVKKDQMEAFVLWHAPFNKLYSKLAAKKQHQWKASSLWRCLQTTYKTGHVADKIWMSSHIGCPDIGFPFDLRWKKEGAVLTPILYEGLTTSEVNSDLICICKGKDHCVAVVPVSRMVCHATNFAPVLPILTNVAMKLQMSSNMIIIRKKKNNIKMKRLCEQNKTLTGFPMNL